MRKNSEIEIYPTYLVELSFKHRNGFDHVVKTQKEISNPKKLFEEGKNINGETNHLHKKQHIFLFSQILLIKLFSYMLISPKQKYSA